MPKFKKNPNSPLKYGRNKKSPFKMKGSPYKMTADASLVFDRENNQFVSGGTGEYQGARMGVSSDRKKNRQGFLNQSADPYLGYL